MVMLGSVIQHICWLYSICCYRNTEKLILDIRGHVLSIGRIVELINDSGKDGVGEGCI